MALPPGTRLGPFEITGPLGAGGMGEVYRATDTNLKRQVAIKVLPEAVAADPDRLARFRREAEILAALNHPNIAHIHGLERTAATTALVMELVEGPTLGDRIARGPIPLDEALPIARQIAEALEAAHERGIVHRDLKPANIKVRADGTVKVLDFGLAKETQPPTAMLQGTAQAATLTSPAMTRAGVVLGTAAYMAPEQARGRPVDRRADLWAFGCVVFEILTGERAFGGDSVADVLAGVITQEPDWSALAASTPANIRTLLRRCLEKDPGRRLESAHDARLEIEETLASPKAATAAPPVATRSRARPGRWWPLASVVVLALAGGLVAWRYRTDSPAATTSDTIASVVALPSKVFASDGDRFLTDAVPNTISTYLTQVQGLETKLPPSSAELARVGDDLDKVGSAYGVSAFVLSSVTVDADRLILNLQLVDARSRRLLWSRDFEGQRGSYLGLTREAAEQLRAAVRPAAAAVAVRAGTSSSEAELAFQRGLHHFNRYNYQHQQDDYDRALAAYQRALQVDPQMAQAAADIGWLHEFRLEGGAPLDEMVPEMERWASRALEIDPNNARAWALRAVAGLLAPNPDFEQVMRAVLRGATRGPRDPFMFNTLAVVIEWRATEVSLAAMNEAMRLDPLYLYPPLNLSEALTYLGRPEEALAPVESVLRIEPGMPIALARKALVLIDMGRTSEAAAISGQLEGFLKEGRIDPALVTLVEDGVAVSNGGPQERTRALDRLVGNFETLRLFYEYPPAYVWLITHGRVDDTLRLMEARARAERVPYDFLRLRPEFRALDGDPRFARILDVSRRQFDEMLAIIDQARSRGEFPALLEQPLAQLRAKLGETK